MNPPLKYPGGKQSLAKIIHSLAPPHIHRVILFGGGLGELWEWGCEGVSEVVNDLDGDIQNLWDVLRNPHSFDVFRRRLEATPFSRKTWDMARDTLNSWPGATIDRALAYFVCCRQSRAGMGDSWTPLTKSRTRRGMNGDVSAWLSVVDGLGDVHARLRRVVVENDDALNVIRREDGVNTFFYADPPYYGVPSLYAHSMTADDHVNLIRALSDIKGSAMISGYRSDLYDGALSEWRRVDVDVNECMGKGSTRRTESLWMNY